MLAKRWTATCDQEGCATTLILEPIPSGDKWDYGRALNDAGWQAAPAVKETMCPEHAIDHDVFVAQIEARGAVEREKWIHTQADELAAMITGRNTRRRR